MAEFVEVAQRQSIPAAANEELMYKMKLQLLTFTLFFALAGTAAAKDHKEKNAHGGGGNKGAAHRSETAGESSNAQWSQGATRGQERAAERRSEHAVGTGGKASKGGDKHVLEENKGSRDGDSDRDSDSVKDSHRRSEDKPPKGERGDGRPEEHDSARGDGAEDRGVHSSGVPKAHTTTGDGRGRSDDGAPATGARQRGFFGRMADFFSGREE